MPSQQQNPPASNKPAAVSIPSLMNPMESSEQKSSSTSVDKRRTRNRIILSCFRCRAMRQKCDRSKPACTRCVSSRYSQCEYMEDFDPRISYNEHLQRLGLTDKRAVRLGDKCGDNCRVNPEEKLQEKAGGKLETSGPNFGFASFSGAAMEPVDGSSSAADYGAGSAPASADNQVSADNAGSYDNTESYDNAGSGDNQGSYDNAGSGDNQGSYDNTEIYDNEGIGDNTGTEDNTGSDYNQVRGANQGNEAAYDGGAGPTDKHTLSTPKPVIKKLRFALPPEEPKSEPVSGKLPPLQSLMHVPDNSDQTAENSTPKTAENSSPKTTPNNIPETAFNNTHNVADQVDRFLLQAALSMKKADRKQTKRSFISILDSSANREPPRSKRHREKSFFDSLFHSDTVVKNKLFANYKRPGEKITFSVTSEASTSLSQMLVRVFSPTIKRIWKIMGMYYLSGIDFNKYKRLKLSVQANTNFLQSWKSNNENVFEQLLKAIPRKFDDFSAIVDAFFTTSLHKSFGFLNETKIREKVGEIFSSDENGNITQIILKENPDQYYLGIIVLIFRMCIDPEEYHHPVFDKVTQIVSDFYMDRYPQSYYRAQFLLLLLFKGELHFMETYSINIKVVDDLLGWAYKADLPKVLREESDLGEDIKYLNNMWYLILYIETLAFLELGLPLRFKHNSFNEATLLTNERGRVPLLRNYIFLARKIFSALENPFEDPDVECIFSKIDEFCHNYLAPLDYYMSLKSSNEVDHFDYLVLTAFMDIKISLLSYKYALCDAPEERQDLRNKLLGHCIASRMIVFTQQHYILRCAENIQESNQFDFISALGPLKTGEKLQENTQRPAWNPGFICPTFGFSFRYLNDKAMTIMEAMALQDMQDSFAEKPNLRHMTLSSSASDHVALDALSAELIEYAVFSGKTPTLTYSLYDILLLDKFWVEKCEKMDALLPLRVSFPVVFVTIFVAKLMHIAELLVQEDPSISSVEEMIAVFEEITPAERESAVESGGQLTRSEGGSVFGGSEPVRSGHVTPLAPTSSLQLTPGVSNPGSVTFQDMVIDLDSMDFSEFIKMLI